MVRIAFTLVLMCLVAAAALVWYSYPKILVELLPAGGLIQGAIVGLLILAVEAFFLTYLVQTFNDRNQRPLRLRIAGLMCEQAWDVDRSIKDFSKSVETLRKSFVVGANRCSTGAEWQGVRSDLLSALNEEVKMLLGNLRSKGTQLTADFSLLQSGVNDRVAANCLAFANHIKELPAAIDADFDDWLSAVDDPLSDNLSFSSFTDFPKVTNAAVLNICAEGGWRETAQLGKSTFVVPSLDPVSGDFKNHAYIMTSPGEYAASNASGLLEELGVEIQTFAERFS